MYKNFYIILNKSIKRTIEEAKKYRQGDMYFNSPFSEEQIKDIKNELKTIREKFLNIFSTKDNDEITKILFLCLSKWWDYNSYRDWNTANIFYGVFFTELLTDFDKSDYLKKNFENY